MFMEMEDDAAVWTIETIIKLKKVIKRNIWFICIMSVYILRVLGKYISRKKEEKEKKKDSIIFINGTRDSSRSRL